MSRARDWYHAATSNLQAAEMLRSNHPRSTISRAYYAAYAASHAVVLHLQGAKTPRRGNFSHAKLPGTLQHVLNRSGISNLSNLSATYTRQITDCQKLRVLADYGADVAFTRSDCEKACRDAGSLVRLAKGLVQ